MQHVERRAHVGLVDGLVGVVVLSEMVTSRDSLKKFMVDWVAGVLIWAHSVIPIGALIGAGIGYDLPSSGLTARFFLSFLCYSLIVLGIVDAVVFFPRMKCLRPLESRTQAFGLILIVSGLSAQLVAAIQDFLS